MRIGSVEPTVIHMHPVFNEAIVRERQRDLERSLRRSVLLRTENQAAAPSPGPVSRTWRRALAAVSSIVSIS